MRGGGGVAERSVFHAVAERSTLENGREGWGSQKKRWEAREKRRKKTGERRKEKEK